MKAVVRALPAGQELGSGVRCEAPAAPAVGTRWSGEEIIARLERAGATLLALPSRGYTTQLRQTRFDIVHTALETYGWEAPTLRVPAPSAPAISAMDEAFGGLGLIPEPSFLLRRILGARALVHPLTGRYLFPWRRLAAAVGADHKSVQRWHAGAVTIVQRRLNGDLGS